MDRLTQRWVRLLDRGTLTDLPTQIRSRLPRSIIRTRSVGMVGRSNYLTALAVGNIFELSTSCPRLSRSIFSNAGRRLILTRFQLAWSNIPSRHSGFDSRNQLHIHLVHRTNAPHRSGSMQGIVVRIQAACFITLVKERPCSLLDQRLSRRTSRRSRGKSG